MPRNTCEAYRLAEKPVRKRGFLHLWWGKLHRAYMTIATKYYMDTLHHHPIPYHPCMVYLPTFTVVFALIPPSSTFFFNIWWQRVSTRQGNFGHSDVVLFTVMSGKIQGPVAQNDSPDILEKNQRPKESNIRCSLFFLIRILVMLSISRLGFPWGDAQQMHSEGEQVRTVKA